jgi:hypothetical protein
MKSPLISTAASITNPTSQQSIENDDYDIELFAGKSGRERDAEVAKMSILEYCNPLLIDDIDHPEDIRRSASELLESLRLQDSQRDLDDLIIIPDSINLNEIEDNERHYSDDLDIPLSIDTFDFHL